MNKAEIELKQLARNSKRKVLDFSEYSEDCNKITLSLFEFVPKHKRPKPYDILRLAKLQPCELEISKMIICCLNGTPLFHKLPKRLNKKLAN